MALSRSRLLLFQFTTKQQQQSRWEFRSCPLQEPRRDGSPRRIPHGSSFISPFPMHSKASPSSIFSLFFFSNVAAFHFFYVCFFQKDRRPNASYSRRASLTYTRTPSRDSFPKKVRIFFFWVSLIFLFLSVF